MERAEAILREIEQVSEELSLPIVGPEKGKILEKVVKEAQPTRILEIGTLIGYSAILMARLLKKDGKVASIEIDEETAGIARRNIWRAGLQDRIEVIVGDAVKVLPRLKEDFDLVFIDATKEEYLTYLRLVEDRLHKGSVVITDNAGIFADAMVEYLNYVRDSGRYKSKNYPVSGDALEVSVKLI